MGSEIKGCVCVCVCVCVCACARMHASLSVVSDSL